MELDQSRSDSAITVPKGGGAIQGIDEAPSSNPATGAGQVSFRVPSPTGRTGFGPSLALHYDSGHGNGPYGLGFDLNLPQISRRTDKGVPRYDSDDRFLFAQAEELVPALDDSGGKLIPDVSQRIVNGATYLVERYRTRVEGAPFPIEHWTDVATGVDHWRSISPDNVITRYGFDANARIADPADPTKVLAWFVDRVADDRGNIVRYEYKPEDASNVVQGASYEANRLSSGFAQRYLKHIRYGNRQPFTEGVWLFQVLFDYGEHDADVPTDKEVRTWPVRADPFSSFRCGFEVRTYRLCHRVLVFHAFDELGPNPVLVQSLNLTYDDDPSVAKLTSLQSVGYVQSGTGYTSASLPPLSLTYAPRNIADEVNAIDNDSRENLTSVTDRAHQMWIDLYREGLPGVLTCTATGWYYKRNLGGGKFAPLVCLDSRPSLAEELDLSLIQFADIDGDGGLELVRFDKGRAGFQRLDQHGWGTFTPFALWPTVPPTDPNLRMVDVDADGRVDLLLACDDRFEWYRGIGAQGFARENSAPRIFNEERGPAITFTEETQTIFLADMTGDGLTDIVRVRNGDITYWPNLGYGRFGAKVAMANAPTFDDPVNFDPSRVRLADIDGSGCADLLYLGRKGAQIYFNLSGNQWSTPITLSGFPAIDDVSTVEVVDIQGTGTATLVWTTPLPSEPGSQLYYIDLLGSQKPHLLVGLANNLGREITLHYAPSTKYYLADEAAGAAWESKIPFVIQTLESIETYDHVTRRRYTSHSSYHNGFYDHVEREFGGFGRVDRYDTEVVEDFQLSGASNVVEVDLQQASILVRTWRHPGCAPSGIDPVDLFAPEYFNRGAIGPPRASPGPPPNWTLAEWLQHFRALRGSVLREEVYGTDASPLAEIPYSVTENTYQVQRRQPQGSNRFAVFTAYGYETISYQCERNAADPRISHSVAQNVNEVGQVTQSATITYPRRTVDSTLPASVQSQQSQIFVSYAESDFTNDVIGADSYRLRVACDSRGWDVLGISPAATFFDATELQNKISTATVITFEATPSGAAERRMVSRSRKYFLADDLSGPLALGTQGTLGLLSHGLSLAFTGNFLTSTYGTRVNDAMMTAAGYVHSEGDFDWWANTGTPVYAANAASHFYRATGARDAFGNLSSVVFDAYDLLPTTVSDALGNTTSCINDYRTLHPSMVTDANGNRTAVTVDALGFVTAIARMGRGGSSDGDTLADPTMRFEYDTNRWINSQLPVVSRTYARERHSDPTSPWQISWAYSDGGGSIVMTKVQAESGLAKQLQPNGTVIDVDTTPNPRYVGNGRTVVNNKGNPIRQYEPYFSVTPEYEDAQALVDIGHSPTYYYDPPGRMIRAEFPNGTHALATFDPWSQASYDPDDAVLTSAWYTTLGSPDPNGPEPTDEQVRAAWLAAKSANTPGVTYSDSLGRAVYALANNGTYGTFGVSLQCDGPRTFCKITDPAGRTASAQYTNIARQVVHSETLDRPPRLVLPDVQGKPARVWDGTTRAFRFAYDAAHRPTALYETVADKEIAISVTLYGELRKDGANVNLRNRVALVCDQAGMVTFSGCDLDGNSLGMQRRFGRDYTATIDWSAVAAAITYADALTAADPVLEKESFTTATMFDALARARNMTVADGTAFTPQYDIGNHLSSLSVGIRGATATQFVMGETHDARGRRLSTQYGNGTVAAVQYDELSARLVGLRVTRTADSAVLQDRSYVYDPVGNVVSSVDAAQQTLYFRNAVVRPAWSYTYDAIYQLRSASGRERAGGVADVQRDWNDLPPDPAPHPNDASAVRNYTETYMYDTLGNILSVVHAFTGGSWARLYAYEAATNRLSSTSLPGDPAGGPYSAKYTYDEFGNTTSMPHLATLQWNAYDQLRQVDLGGGGTAYYVYDGNGARARKVIVSGGLTKDRKYVGPFELYREITSGAVRLERQTVHVSESGHRLAQADTKTVDTSNPAGIGVPAIRYQYQDALGSASITCDERGSVIGYEEYLPFGATAYRSSRNDAETSLKRYRYLDRERDEETGFYCCGVRYCVSWLGRWLSPDLGGFVDGLNLYRYAKNQPTTRGDPSGYVGPNKVEWIVPEYVTTVKRFENWARATGIRYTGTPTYDPQAHIWSVNNWEKVRRGTGGPAAPPPPAAPPTPPASSPSPANAPPADSTPSTTGAAGSSNPGGGTAAGNGAAADGAPQEQDLNVGNIARYKDQPRAVYDAAGNRLTENEHIDMHAALEDLSTNDAGNALYNDTRYKNDITLRLDYATSRAKTNLDNAYLQRLRSGQEPTTLSEVTENFRQNTLSAIETTASEVSEETVNTTYLSQVGELFKTTALEDVASHLPPGPPSSFTGVLGSLRGFAGAAGGVAVGVGGALLRGFVPGFVEAEGAIAYAGVYLSATFGAESTIGSMGAALAAAPAAATTVILASGVAGFFVGDAVEQAVTKATGSRTIGVAAGVGAAAVSGALIGAAIGSVVPGLGTAVGAGIGAAAGAIAGFIGAYW